jgi:hypothetical protein
MSKSLKGGNAAAKEVARAPSRSAKRKRGMVEEEERVMSEDEEITPVERAEEVSEVEEERLKRCA